MSSRWPTRSSGSDAGASAVGAAPSGQVVNDSTGRAWTKSGDWCLKTGPWRITKSLVGGERKFTLTHDARSTRWCAITTPAILGVFDSAREAMEAAK